MFKLPASVFWGLYFRKVLSLFNSCAIKSHTYTVDGNFLSSDILQLLWRFWPWQDKLEHFGIIKQCTPPPLTPNCPHSLPPTHQKQCPIHPHSPPPTQNNPHSLKIMRHLHKIRSNNPHLLKLFTDHKVKWGHYIIKINCSFHG